MPGRRDSNGRPTILRLSPGPSPRLRWGERVPLAATDAGGLVLDLTDIQFAEPTLALRLAASEAVHDAEGIPFGVVPPRRPKVRDYLARAGLADLMGLEDPPQASDVMMPITRVRRVSDVEGVVEQFGNRLDDASDLLPGRLAGAADALVVALSELCGNACSHGRNDHGTFVLAQRFGASRLVLAIGDLGVGIPVHLREALSLSEQTAQAEVIRQALERGVTGVRGQIRGNGLPATVEAIRELGMPAAELGIWSGAGRVRAQMRPQPALRHRVRDVSSYTQGTWIEVVLSSTPSGRP